MSLFHICSHLNNFCASDCYLLSCLSRTEMKFAVLWAQVYELRVYSFIYLQCLSCNENKIMTQVYISARQTGAGDTQTVARGEYRPNFQAARLPVQAIR